MKAGVESRIGRLALALLLLLGIPGCRAASHSAVRHPGRPTPTSATISTATLPASSEVPAPPDLSAVALPQAFAFQTRTRGWGIRLECSGTATRQTCAYGALVSDDGGRTWAPTGPSPLEEGLANLSVEAFVDHRTGWVTGPVSSVTRDAGATWRHADLPERLTSPRWDGRRYWAISRSCEDRCRTIVASTDGEHWTKITAQPPGLPFLGGFALDGPGVLVAWGSIDETSPLRLRRTSDGGRSWAALQVPSHCGDPGEDRVAAASSSTLWLACGSQPTSGQQFSEIYRSLDGGRHWRLTTDNYPADWARPDGGGPLGDLPNSGSQGELLLTPDRVLLDVRGKIAAVARTTDGTHWTSTPLPFAFATNIDFIDASHGWLASAQLGCLLATTDGGVSWQVVAASPRSGCTA